jgi:hypothetical protein
LTLFSIISNNCRNINEVLKERTELTLGNKAIISVAFEKVFPSFNFSNLFYLSSYI